MLTNFCLTSSITMMHRPTIDLSPAVESAVQTFLANSKGLMPWSSKSMPRPKMNDWTFRFFSGSNLPGFKRSTQLEMKMLHGKTKTPALLGIGEISVGLSASMKFLLFEVPSVSFLWIEHCYLHAGLSWGHFEKLLDSNLLAAISRAIWTNRDTIVNLHKCSVGHASKSRQMRLTSKIRTW